MFKLSLLTPERKIIFDQEITEITVPAKSGERQILPGHIPMVASLGTGILKFTEAGTNIAKKFVISWGYCEVNSAGVNILAEFVQSKEEVNLDDAKLAITVNQAKLVNQNLTDDEFELALTNIQKAQSSITLAN